MDGADGHHRHVVGVHFARHDGLQGQYDAGGRHDGVHRHVRHRAMAAHAADRQHHGIGRAVHDAGSEPEMTGRIARFVMEAVDSVAREAVEQAVGDHLLRAAVAFFSRLEDQMHGAVELAALRQRIARRTGVGAFANYRGADPVAEQRGVRGHHYGD
ncbi:hypothetical protein G6F40_014292 [Rhizopus arrhizus]|nr:hypothetical protein G6F40_014292 [Rhizopus arrhizus]